MRTYLVAAAVMALGCDNSEKEPEPADACLEAFAQSGDVEAICASGCEASYDHDALNPEGSCGMGSQSRCQSQCWKATANTTRECASCIAQNLEWFEAQLGDDYCFPPEPRQMDIEIQADLCVEECEVTRECRVSIRTRADSPEPVGRQPDAALNVVGLGEDAEPMAVASRANGWLLASHGAPPPGEPYGLLLVHEIARDGRVTSWSVGGASREPQGILHAEDSYFVLFEGSATQVTPVGQTGVSFSASSAGTFADGSGFWYIERELAPETNQQNYRLWQVDSNGNELSSLGLEAPLNGLSLLVEPGNPGRGVGLGRNPDIVRALDLQDGGGELWTTEVEGETVSPTLGGDEHGVSVYSRWGGLIRLDLDSGEELGRWESETKIFSFETIVRVDASGHTYVATSEYPYGTIDFASGSDPLPLKGCAAYGCNRAALRKFDIDGRLEWEYLRVEETSEMVDFNLDPSPVMLVRVHGESESYRVLRWDE